MAVLPDQKLHEQCLPGTSAQQSQPDHLHQLLLLHQQLLRPHLVVLTAQEAPQQVAPLAELRLEPAQQRQLALLAGGVRRVSREQGAVLGRDPGGAGQAQLAAQTGPNDRKQVVRNGGVD